MREKFSNSSTDQADDFTPEVDRNGASRRTTADNLRLLWERRRYLLRLAWIGLIVCTIIAIAIPSRYESTTRLMPPDQSNSGMAMLSAALGRGAGGSSSSTGSSLGSVAGDLLGIKNTGDLFIGILHSRTVEDALINKFDLRKVYWDRYMKDAREDLESKTDIVAERKSGIISIKVSDRKAKRAAAMAQEYVDQLNQVVTHVNTSAAGRERAFLEDRLSQVKNDLENAEKGFSDFASKNTALDIPAQGKAMIEAAAAVEGQLILAQTELQSLTQIYADGNVRVRSMRARVAELQRQLEKVGGKYDIPADAKDQSEASMYPSIRKLPVLGITYADLYRNTKVQEAIFGTLTQEFELAKVQEAKETPSVKIIDYPDVPEKKYFPPRILIACAGALLFALFGIARILGGFYWSAVDSRDPGKALAEEVFQSVKSMSPVFASNGDSNGDKKRSVWSRFGKHSNGNGAGTSVSEEHVEQDR